MNEIHCNYDTKVGEACQVLEAILSPPATGETTAGGLSGNRARASAFEGAALARPVFGRAAFVRGRFPESQEVSPGCSQSFKETRRGSQGASLNACAAPPCNTGVENTGVRLGIDWLRVSQVKVTKGVLEILRGRIARSFGSTGEAVNGSWGYEGVNVACYGRFMWKRRAHASLELYDVLVDLPGQAMEYIRSVLTLPDCLTIQMFRRLGFKETRCDIAVDSGDTLLNPQVVYDHLCRPDCVVTHATAKNAVLGKTPVGKPSWTDGQKMTVYIGSRQSERFMRVYDKTGEKEEKTGKRIPHTTRFELECKGAAAEAVALQVEEHGNAVIPRLLAGWIDFLAVSGKDAADSNKSRRRGRVAWWQRIVDGERVILHLQKGMATPERTLAWMSKTCARSIKLAQEFDRWPDVQAAADRARIPLNTVRRWRCAFERGEQQIMEELRQ